MGLELSELDGTQLQAARAPLTGSSLVIAGPGTGKTRVIEGRVRYLIKKGADPTSIACLAFTRRAAQEIRTRLMQVPGADRAFVGTFHSWCLHVLAETQAGHHWVLSPAQRWALAEEVIRRFSPAEKHLHRLVKKLLKDVDAGRQLRILGENSSNSAVREYEALLRSREAYDYGALEVEVVESGKALRYIHDRWQHILIDEAQDCSRLEVGLLSVCADNVYAVGDPYQRIFSFRMPCYFNALREIDAFWSPRRFRLGTTYRHSKAVAKECSRLFDMPDPGPAAEEGAVINHFGKPLPNALEVVMGILEGEAEYSFCDVAVLVRTRRALDKVAEMLDTMGVPCVVQEHPDRRELTADEKFAGEVRDFVRGIEDEMGTAMLRNRLLDLRDELDVSPGLFAETWRAAAAGGEAMANAAAWIDPSDVSESDADAVRVLTAHAAKGLEFPVVVVPEIEEGGYPPRQSSDLAEEMRVLFVAMTRAETTLILQGEGRSSVYP